MFYHSAILPTFTLYLFLILHSGPVIGQQVLAIYTTQEISLDGVLDENIWSDAQTADNFWQFFPNDSTKATYGTEVRVVYNETTLYVGIRAETPSDNFVVASLKRDFSGTKNDNVTLLFDTFNDGTNAFAFGVTPYGVRREILISNGGSASENFNVNWDVKWKAESKIFDNYYIVEMAIPFTSLKFEEGATNTN